MVSSLNFPQTNPHQLQIQFGLIIVFIRFIRIIGYKQLGQSFFLSGVLSNCQSSTLTLQLMDSFPDEIVINLLRNLPVESILICRSVCKLWCKLIDNPQFAQLHFNTSKPKLGNTSSLVLLSSYYDELYTAKAEDANLSGTHLKTTLVEISCNVRTNNYAEPMVNGLLLMHPFSNCSSDHDRLYSVYICNPATRDCVELPKINPISSWRIPRFWGFGFDAISNEFKAVHISTYTGVLSTDTMSEVQVYTLGSNSWKNVGKAPDWEFVKELSAFVNGSSHWLAGNGSENSASSLYIVSFNYSSEDFGVVPTPKFGYVPNPALCELTVLGECLSLVDSTFQHHVDIWIMKDYDVKDSWIKYSVTKYYMGHYSWTTQVLSLREDSEIVLLLDYSKLVSYNFVSKRFTSFEIDGIPGYSLQGQCSQFCYQVYSFVESLFSLKGAV